jgi:toxin ParE1/3/4
VNTYRITKQAESDLEEIYVYVAQYSRAAANRLHDLFFDRFQFLADTQQAGTQRDDLRRGLRLFSARDYVIFFFVNPSGVEIAGVLHGARDYELMYRLGER